MNHGGLDVRNLHVGYGRRGAMTPILHGASLKVARGETVGLVGESGSGKSTLAHAVLGSLPAQGQVTGGTITLAGDDLLALRGAKQQALWRHRVRLVPQDPLPALNPSMRIGRQLAEAADPLRPARVREADLDAMLDAVGVADPSRIRSAYPFELSGGQQQRVMIAMGLLGTPELLVMDEPTTNLDVTTEAAILDLVRTRVQRDTTAVLYVSHSLGVVASLCDRVVVLYAGRIVETAPVRALYAKPLHPYTAGLLAAVPQLGRDDGATPLRPIHGHLPRPGVPLAGCVFAARCPVARDACHEAPPPHEVAPGGREVACHRWQEIAAGTLDPLPARPSPVVTSAVDGGANLTTHALTQRYATRGSRLGRGWGRSSGDVLALRGVSLRISAGQTLGLVGESGSGKSTFARTVVGLEAATEGHATLDGHPLAAKLSARTQRQRRNLQMVFQSSDEALPPHRTVEAILARPLQRLGGVPRQQLRAAVTDLLAAVHLPENYLPRTPAQLSGGERQRVAIARAFASHPGIVLFDESVSGLDVSVQAAVLNLVQDLQRERGTGYLFIGHDVAVVGHLADEIAVLYLGAVVEVGPTKAVLEPPYHPYTEALLAAVPRPDPTARAPYVALTGELPSPREVPRGCAFATRCPRSLGAICRDQPPPARRSDDGTHVLHCHIPRAELADLQRDLLPGNEAS